MPHALDKIPWIYYGDVAVARAIMADIEGDQQRTIVLNGRDENRQILAISKTAIQSYLYGIWCGHNSQTPGDQ